MDPVTHTFTGAALATSGLRRATPLATAALLISANAPDIDVITWFGGRFAALEFRRGWTHGVLAVAVLPFVVTGVLLLWDRWLRRTRQPAAPPARPGPLLSLSALGIATHPVLDWLNNYGIRWLMPFDDRWFYGDALFIIDPWVWLALGGALFLAYSATAVGLAGWGAFWLLTSYLMLTNELVPSLARILWLIGLGSLLLARRFYSRVARDGVERTARAVLAVMVCYMVAGLAANFPARAQVRAELASLGVESVGRVMVAPVPANPFRASVIAETPAAYYIGWWQWFGRPRFEFGFESIPRQPAGPAVIAASRTRDARRFLTWARFPYFEVSSDDDGHVIRFGDARYAGIGRGPVSGLVVHLDTALQPQSSR